MQKPIVAFLFIVFVVIRLKYGRGVDQREQFHHKRELILTSVFTLTLLVCYVAYFSQNNQILPLQYSAKLVWFGGILGLLGNALLYWVHHCLGTNFSPHLEIRSEHTLIQNGPYQYVRHPMYSSGYLFLLGCGFLSQDGILLVPPVITFTLLLVFRLSDEEKMLEEKFGDDWRRYKSTTKKVFPLIF